MAVAVAELDASKPTHCRGESLVAERNEPHVDGFVPGRTLHIDLDPSVHEVETNPAHGRGELG